MQALITVQQKMSVRTGHARLTLTLMPEELQHLIQGSVHPRVNIEGNVADGVRVLFRENDGRAMTISGYRAYFSLAASLIMAADTKVGTETIPTQMLRGEDGPYLQTGRFPLPFIAKDLRPKLGWSRDPQVEPTPQAPALVHHSGAREQPANGAPEPTPPPPPPPLGAPPPRINPSHILNLTERSGDQLGNLKTAIAIVNELMPGLDELVKLKVEDNRLKALLAVVKLEEL